MFDKKEKKAEEEKDDDVKASVHSIPAAFYGGKDPNIYQASMDPVAKDTKKEEEKLEEKEKEIKKEALRKSTMAPAVVKPPLEKKHMQQIQQPNSQLQRPKEKKTWLWILIIGMIVIVGLAVAAWFVLKEDAKPAVVPAAPVIEKPEPPAPEPPAPVVTLPDPIVEPPASEQDELIVESFLTINRADIDNDGLTDEEEEFFTTDPGIADSDQDGYIDGLEVSNLYSPQGFAPTKLIDSGLVREFQSIPWGYRMYYPATWVVDEVDVDERQVLVSTITGDFVEITVFDKLVGEELTDWFGRVVQGQRFDQLRKNTTRFSVEGYLRNDLALAFIEDDLYVYAIVYRAGVGKSIVYPHVLEMIYQSFRPDNASGVLEEQVVLPTPPVFDEVVTSSPTVEETQEESGITDEAPVTEDLNDVF